MRFSFSHLYLPRRWTRVSSAVAGGWLLLAGLSAAAQAPSSVPEPLPSAAPPARPTDFLTPAFHRQRRELLRAKLPPQGVAVVFAAPVRNRANDVNYVYHQTPTSTTSPVTTSPMPCCCCSRSRAPWPGRPA